MKADQYRDHVAFWIFGMANSFAFIVMLTAAQDIMQEQTGGGSSSGNQQSRMLNANESDYQQDQSVCQTTLTNHECVVKPLGPVLLANILPAFVIKLTMPFILHRIPFSVLHILVCAAQATSYILVAFTTSIEMSLFGVAFAAISSGLGDICYLALASHYDRYVLNSWASGTGGSGILGSLSYAALTEPQLANLRPQVALLIMLAIPALFFLTYFFLLTPAPTVYRPHLLRPSTWIVPKSQQLMLAHKSPTSTSNCNSSPTNEDKQKIFTIENSDYKDAAPDKEIDVESLSQSSSSCSSGSSSADCHGGKKKKSGIAQKARQVFPLLKYIIPLTTVYYADYLVNQGMTAFLVFDCAHGFGLSRESQYRWYQVIYCMGAFLARSTANFFHMPYYFLIVFPLYEIANAVFFFFESLHFFIPHISIVFVLVLVEGMIGGASYANTYFRIHSEVDPSVKEFSLSITTLSDVVGIAAAGLSTLPIHSVVCKYNAVKTTS